MAAPNGSNTDGYLGVTAWGQPPDMADLPKLVTGEYYWAFVKSGNGARNLQSFHLEDPKWIIVETFGNDEWWELYRPGYDDTLPWCRVIKMVGPIPEP